MPQRASVTDLAFEFQDQPEHAVRRGVLRAHVDHDPLVAAFGLLRHQRVPVLAGDRVDVAFGRVAAGSEGSCLRMPDLSGAAGGPCAHRSCS